MLSLYSFVSDSSVTSFSLLYLIFKQLIQLVIFYPTGIFLSLIIIFWLFYITISCSKILLFLIKMLGYFFEFKAPISLLVNILGHRIFFYLHLMLSNLLFFFSNYLYVFYFKRLEYYCWLLFIVCVFVN